MIDFSTVSSVAIPEGEVKQIAVGDTVLWAKNSAPLYPFKNGKWTFSNGEWIEITNGNHVHCYAKSTKGFFNLSDIEQNTTTATDASNINNKPKWFTIPSGSVCELTISNLSGYLNDANFRLAEESTSGTFFVGQSKNTYSVSLTTTEDIDIGCFFTYINKTGETEFDITFTVDGVRWI